MVGPAAQVALVPLECVPVIDVEVDSLMVDHVHTTVTVIVVGVRAPLPQGVEERKFVFLLKCSSIHLDILAKN